MNCQSTTMLAMELTYQSQHNVDGTFMNKNVHDKCNIVFHTKYLNTKVRNYLDFRNVFQLVMSNNSYITIL